MNTQTESVNPAPVPTGAAPQTDEASGRDRWVRLSDGRLGLRRGLVMEVREPSDPQPSTLNPQPSAAGNSQPILDFIASDETMDRYDEVIVPSGWRLESYRRNPVFQNAHQYGDVLFTLGKALITEVRGGGRRGLEQAQEQKQERGAGPSNLDPRPSTSYLFQRIQFATDVNPIARIAYGLYKGKFLNAVSVGFIPLRWEDLDGSPPGERAGMTEEREQEKEQDPPLITDHRSLFTGPSLPTDHRSLVPVLSPCPSPHATFPTDHRSLTTDHSSPCRSPRRRYLEQELLEVSAVAIPANPNALALGLKSGVVATADLRDSLDLLRALCCSLEFQTGSGPCAGRAAGADLQNALMLARALREVLRRA
jgi:hypothetical protein